MVLVENDKIGEDGDGDGDEDEGRDGRRGSGLC